MELIQTTDGGDPPGGAGAERRATSNIHWFTPKSADNLNARPPVGSNPGPAGTAGQDGASKVGAMLYLEHFGLREHPFSLTPDTSYYFDYFNYREALNVLLVSLRSGEGFVKLTGDVGTGKTLLCRRLMDLLGDEFVTAYVPNPLLSAHGLLKAVAEELRLNVSDDLDGYEIIKRITHRLASHHSAGKNVAVLIDEAQVMSRGCLEAVRLLSNIETEKSKLLQVVLFAQPELDQRLGGDKLRQFRQRITFSHQLQPLDKSGMVAYINHRIMVAGYSGKPPFSPGAIYELFRASRGVPRLVNILCHKSLMLAFGIGARQITREMVREAISETEGVFMGQRQGKGRWLGMAVALPLMLGLGWYMGKMML